MNEVGPEPNLFAVDVRSMDDDDIGVANSRQISRLGEEPTVAATLCRRLDTPELERHFALELRVDRPVHLAEAAATDQLEHLEMAPAEERGDGAFGLSRRRTAGRKPV